MPSPEPLLSLQRRFAAALREPLWGESRAATGLAPREVGPSADFLNTARESVTPSRSLAAVDRLELYHRQYWYRLLDSLAEDFPSLRRRLGETRFWGLLEAYLAHQPPSTPTLRHLGAGLADFLEGEAGVPLAAVELARLEYALCVAFDAGERPAVAPEALAQGPLALQPHVQRFAFRTPADSAWRRPGPASSEPTVLASRFVVVFRLGEVPQVERVPGAAFRLLEAIEATRSLELALERLVASPGRGRGLDSERVRGWFSTWAARRWFCRPLET